MGKELVFLPPLFSRGNFILQIHFISLCFVATTVSLFSLLISVSAESQYRLFIIIGCLLCANLCKFVHICAQNRSLKYYHTVESTTDSTNFMKRQQTKSLVRLVGTKGSRGKASWSSDQRLGLINCYKGVYVDQSVKHI